MLHHPTAPRTGDIFTYMLYVWSDNYGRDASRELHVGGTWFSPASASFALKDVTCPESSRGFAWTPYLLLFARDCPFGAIQPQPSKGLAPLPRGHVYMLA